MEYQPINYQPKTSRSRHSSRLARRLSLIALSLTIAIAHVLYPISNIPLAIGQNEPADDGGGGEAKDHHYFERKYGIGPDSGVYDPLDLEEYASAFSTLQGHAIKWAAKFNIDPEMIVLWSFVETEPPYDSWSYSYCGASIPMTQVCRASTWQLGYGHQFAQISDMDQAFQDIYGDPNDAAKTAQVLQSVASKSGMSAPPQNLTAANLSRVTLNSSDSDIIWAAALSRDQAISSYLLAKELADDVQAAGSRTLFAHACDNWGSGYCPSDNFFKKFGDYLADILANWGNPSSPTSGSPSISGPTEPPVDLVVPDCPGVTRTINAFKLPPSIYPKPNCGGGTPGAGTNQLGQPTGKYGTTSDGPPEGTLFWVITGGQVYRLSQGYGLTEFASGHTNGMYSYCNNYGVPGHCGIDLSAPIGTQTFSPVAGTVVCDMTSTSRQGDPTESCSAFGNANSPNQHKGRLEIKLDNGDYLILGHMQSITVRLGDRVTVGQSVGTSGQMASEGGHLHIEYRALSTSTASGKTTYDPRDMFDVPYNSTTSNLQTPNSNIVASRSSLVANLIPEAQAQTTTATNFNTFATKYGFLTPTKASSIDFAKYKDNFAQARDAAVKHAPKFNLEPEMVVWWTYFETKAPYDSVSYQNCLENYLDINQACSAIGYGSWQVGYGQQYAKGLDEGMAKVFQETHGDPNDTALVKKVGQAVLDKAGINRDFPSTTVANLMSNESANRYWIFTLQRDPDISSYLLAAEIRMDLDGRPNMKWSDIMAQWSSAYYGSDRIKQLYSNIMNDILLNWGVAGSGVAGSICQVGAGVTNASCSTVPDVLNGLNVQEFTDKINANMDSYKQIAQCANVPWQMMAAIHLREMGLKTQTSHNDGPWQLDPPPPGVDQHNFIDAGCWAAKNRLSAKIEEQFAGTNLKPLNQNMDPSKKEDEYSIKAAFFGYNGTGGWQQNVSKGCTPAIDGKDKWNWDCSAYVMNNMDDKHIAMTIGIGGGQEFPTADDGAWKIYYKLFYSTYGGDGKLLVYGGNCTVAGQVVNGLAAPTKAGIEISSNFWQPYTGQFAYLGNHHGIDIAGRNGEPVFALADGEIVSSGYTQNTGYHIIIKVSANGSAQNTADRWVYYGHLSADGIEGTGPVTAGQQIAKIGKTTELVNGQEVPNGITGGEHLHLDIRTQTGDSSSVNNHVNPCSLDLFRNTYSTLNCSSYGSQGQKWL